ncbi:MAG: PAS domain S-box protein [Marinospirillum sp.]|uniref:PAS domain-containing sensor histidine kinase n=1 Tax=Marinospirillum sp. TaxID=2183934 RepID=UPI0019E35912|nr:PAS domain-containing sensor histidine kinase [Marinospirillum sp.]MBE0505166.1 PAS domain S-box protein [Marinospirillum sp.]
MTKMNEQRQQHLQDLRERAEKALAEGLVIVEDAGAGGEAGDGRLQQMQALGEELRIYQAELEIQNQELRFAQLSLEAERKKYAALFENLPIPALVIDQHGAIREANPQAAYFLLFNHHSAQLKNHSVYRFIGAEGRLWLASALHELYEFNSSANFRTFQNEIDITLNRETIPALAKLADLPSDYYLDRSFLLTLVDLTAQRDVVNQYEAFQAVLEQRPAISMGFNEQSFDASSASVVITDVNQHVVYVNPTFCRISGYQTNEVLGKKPSIWKSHHTSPETYESLKQHLKNGSVWIGKFVNTCKDGGTWTEQRAIQPFLNQEQQVAGYISIGFDLTQQVMIEEQAQRVGRIEAIATVIAGLAHEFNNLLGSINGLTEVNMTLCDPDSPIYKNLEQVLLAGTRAETLVQQLKNGTSIQASEKTQVDLNQMIQGQMNLLHSAAGAMQMRFMPHDQPLAVWLDVPYFLQTLVNLVRNAKDATQETKNPTCWIQLSLYMQPTFSDEYQPFADIKVKDNGCGMSLAVQERLFDPFFTTKEVGKGTGLGMMQVLNFIKHHDGLIDVHSYPRAGTEFTLRLPLAIAQRSSLNNISPEIKTPD